MITFIKFRIITTLIVIQFCANDNPHQIENHHCLQLKMDGSVHTVLVEEEQVHYYLQSDYQCEHFYYHGPLIMIMIKS